MGIAINNVICRICSCTFTVRASTGNEALVGATRGICERCINQPILAELRRWDVTVWVALASALAGGVIGQGLCALVGFPPTWLGFGVSATVGFLAALLERRAGLFRRHRT